MTAFEILTPSYRPDLALFRELHRSVLEFTDPGVRHRVLVPKADIELFRAIRSDRLDVTSVETFLPHTAVSVRPVTRTLSRIPRMQKLSKVQSVDVKQPWPPLRGWILQQIVKLAAAADSDADTVLVVDSDVCLIRHVRTPDLRRDGVTRLYADPGGVTASMVEHRAWHDNARTLLGLHPTSSENRPDYIAGFVTWDPVVVRQMLAHVAVVSGRDWVRTVAASLRFSECTLYGTYMDNIADSSLLAFTRDHTRCASHWNPVSLDSSTAARLIDAVGPDDLAVQIQSTSHTPIAVRRALIADAVAKF